jgi:hypothetical protein
MPPLDGLSQCLGLLVQAQVIRVALRRVWTRMSVKGLERLDPSHSRAETDSRNRVGVGEESSTEECPLGGTLA